MKWHQPQDIRFFPGCQEEKYTSNHHHTYAKWGTRGRHLEATILYPVMLLDSLQLLDHGHTLARGLSKPMIRRDVKMRSGVVSYAQHLPQRRAPLTRETAALPGLVTLSLRPVASELHLRTQHMGSGVGALSSEYIMFLDRQAIEILNAISSRAQNSFRAG